MNILQKQSVQKTGSSILLTLLLSVAVFLSSLCVSAWNTINAQFPRLERDYITYAIQTDKMLKQQHFDAVSPANTSAHTRMVDQRLLLSAHVAGMIALPTGRLDYMEYISDMDNYCYNFSVAALECVDVEMLEINAGWMLRTVTFRIVDWVSRSDAYDIPPHEDFVQMLTDLVDEEGKEIFQTGKTYLVRGFYRDYPVLRTSKYADRLIRGTFPEYEDIYRQIYEKIEADYLLKSPEHFTYSPVYSSDDANTFVGYSVTDGIWPAVSEYTGSWEDFLETEAGRVWKDEIIPYTRINQNSAPVILTDNLESVPGFVVGDARLLEGRTFNATEYTQGSQVCVVSSQYATLNGLKIGDSINLDFYDTGAETVSYNYSMDLSGTHALCRYPMTSANHMGVKADYTIVGIYTSPGLKGSLHDFGNDTIFVPKNSVPGWERCAVTSHPSLCSVVIQNGSIEAFENDMAAAGFPEAFHYYDQGYSELEDYLQTLLRHAQTMLIIGLPIFVLVVLVFLLLEGKRRSLVIRSMRLLGIKRGVIWKQSVSAILRIAVVAVAVGNVLSMLFFRIIMEGIISAEMHLDFGGVALFAIAQLLFISMLTALWMYGAANRNLLKRK